MREIRRKNIANKNKYLDIRIVGVVVVVLAILFAGHVIFRGRNLVKKSKENMLQDISKTVEEDSKKNITVDFAKLQKENKDTVAYIKIKGTEIGYPLVQTTDNSYYLEHNFKKEKDKAGWIFVDCDNKLDGTDKNIVIYGHGGKEGTPLVTLKNCISKKWQEEKDNRVISLVTENGEVKYEIFSAYTEQGADYYIQKKFPEGHYVKYLETLAKKSIVKWDTSFAEEDKIITISTCTDKANTRFVVHAKKII